MAASDHLSGYQFSYTKPKNRLNAINVTHNGQDVGELTWANHRGSNAQDLAPHEIGSVIVDKDHRRRGVATQMWHMARSIDPEVAHSGDKTPAGHAWAKSVGGLDPWSED